MSLYIAGNYLSYRKNNKSTGIFPAGSKDKTIKQNRSYFFHIKIKLKIL